MSSTYQYTSSPSRHGVRPNKVFPSTGKWAGFVRSTDDPTVMKGLEPSPLRKIEVPDALPGHLNVEPKKLRPVSAYNWTDRAQPTIIVPGCPRIWKNKSAPFFTSRDSGKIYIDQNKYRLPNYPLLPLFTAIDHLNPDFSFTSMDIITDRNNLRKLTRFIEGSVSSENDFRIDLQLVGESTVLFVRHEQDALDPDPGRRGYGNNFEKTTTEPYPGCEESTAHHRIVTYDLSGMKVLLRFEVDACLHTGAPKQPPPSLNQSPSRTATNVDDLSSLLSSLSVSSKSDDVNNQDTNSPSTPTIKVISAGELVEQNSIIELTTRSNRSLQDGFDWRKHFPQLFFSQTPHHYLGVHVNGNFHRIDHSLLKCDFANGQDSQGGSDVAATGVSKFLASYKDRRQCEQQGSFDKLRALLQVIHELVVTAGRTARLSLVYKHDTGEMHVHRRISSADALPKSWMNRLNGGKGSKDRSRAVSSIATKNSRDEEKQAKKKIDGV